MTVDVKTLNCVSLFLLLSFMVFAGPGHAVEDRYFNSNGVKLRYTDQGKGEAVVLIPGLLGTVETNWEMPGIISRLSKEYRVIGMDLRAHGKSGKPKDALAYGMEMVKDVVRLLDHLKIKKAHVASYSYGGTIALKLLATYPERLHSVILGETSWAEEGNDEVNDFYESLARSLDEGKGFGPLMKSLTPEGEKPPPEEELKKMTEEISRDFDLKALSALLRGSRELTVAEPALKSNKVPCLLIYGTKSSPSSEAALSLGKAMQNLEIHKIEGADHFSALFCPEFLQAVEKFLYDKRLRNLAE
ncbi:MAG: alpha/beta hydrolase [Planctomycetota bacterium]